MTIESKHPLTDIDLYELLQVEKTASESEIKSSYRKLALKYHPDRNPGNEEAVEQFQQIAMAYNILADPNKRRQYDVSGKDGNAFEYESVDVEQMGNVARVLGALCSKLGIPIPTQISSNALSVAREICDKRVDVTHKVHELSLQHEVEGRVQKQECTFYQLTLTDEEAKEGILLDCRSAQRGKFKLVLFDEHGAVSIVKESMKNDKSSMTVVSMLLTNQIQFYDVNKDWLNYKSIDPNVPVIFQRLCTLLPSKEVHLSSGTHLIGVYGDNWLSQVKYKLRCARMKSEKETIQPIQETEDELIELKQTLEAFQPKYLALKKEYVEAEEKVEESNRRIVELIRRRDEEYEKYTDMCFVTNESVVQKSQDKPPSQGIFSVFSRGLKSVSTNSSKGEK